MGFYINVPNSKDKASQLARLHGAVLLDNKPEWSEIPSDKALVVVVENQMFDAVALAYNEREYVEFTRPADHRIKHYLLMDKELAGELSGFNKIKRSALW